MALISPKNFMTPFTNKVHLATIAFVVILFAAFRAMGGAFSLQHGGQVGRSVSPKSVSIVEEPMANRAENDAVDGAGIDDLLPESTSRSGMRPNDRDEIDVTVRAVPQKESAPKQAPANDLDEIIRRLNAR